MKLPKTESGDRGSRLKRLLMQIRFLLAVLLLSNACVSVSPSGGGVAGEGQETTEKRSCAVFPVGGDTRGVAVGPHSLLIVGEGIGLLRSEDDGRSFETLAPPGEMHWPSITAGAAGVMVSWIRPGEVSTLRVAAAEDGLRSPVDVYTSKRSIIDTEIMARKNGGLLLLATEVDGPPNCNQAAYTVHCFASKDGGRSWKERSRPVSGPWGVNIEDPRLVELENGRILLAFEWEEEEGGPSRILMEYSDDGGRSFSAPEPLWDGNPADREPGGFFRRNGLLYFVGSSDRGSGLSYAGARLMILVSGDGGTNWETPFSPVPNRNQLSMGAIVLDDRVLLPSLRFYKTRHPQLYLYPLDSLGLWLLPCPGLSGRQGELRATP